MSEETQVDNAVEPAEESAVVDTLATPEVKQERPKPQAHKGQITTVEFVIGENQRTGEASYRMEIDLLSEHTADVKKLMIFFPRTFAEEFVAVQSGELSPTDFPQEEGNKQRTSYAMNISNSDGTSTLQRLRKVAAESERVSTEKPTSIEEFVELHGELLRDLPVIFTMSVDNKPDDPTFKNVLKVRNILTSATEFDTKVIARLKKRGFVIMWEEEG